jgi:hypothetical protein
MDRGLCEGQHYALVIQTPTGITNGSCGREVHIDQVPGKTAAATGCRQFAFQNQVSKRDAFELDKARITLHPSNHASDLGVGPCPVPTKRKPLLTI